MKRAFPIKERERSYLMADYGRRRLIHYADSFRAIAKNLNREGACKPLFGSNDSKEQEEQDSDGFDRSLYLFYEKLQENKDILAGNLREMAGIMSKIAGEVFAYRPFPNAKMRRIRQNMKMKGIHVSDVYYIEEDDVFRIAISMNAEHKRKYDTLEVAGFLSELLNQKLLPSRECPCVVDEFLRTFVFAGKTSYGAFFGAAKAIKETETISGDNYSVTESEKGYLHVLLSDGMGSGEKACADSEAVLSLMEEFLEAGYETHTAAHLANTTFLAGEEGNMSTLDICSINLYSGVCEFIKSGACASYIKHGQLVEKIYDSTFPLGVFGKEVKNGFCRKLSDGDMVILISDGVMDVFDDVEYGEGFRELICHTEEEDPKLLAKELLQVLLYRAGGHIRDDMTVLVVKVYENK